MKGLLAANIVVDNINSLSLMEVQWIIKITTSF